MGVLDKLRLDGKLAVVTGAGRGLGRAMAIALAEAGCDIVAAARTTRSRREDAAEYLTGQVVWIEGGALSHV